MSKAYPDRPRTETELAAVETLIDKQDNGYEKYGRGIDYKYRGFDWVNECIEELADGLQYAVAARLHMTAMCSEMLMIVGHLRSEVKEDDKAQVYLDALENRIRALKP